MEHSIEEAERLAEAYRECDELHRPLSRMLDDPADVFTVDCEDRSGNDAAALAAVNALWPTARPTAEWLHWAAAWVAEQQNQSDWSDKESLAATLSDIDPVCVAAGNLAREAIPRLEAVQRGALARHLISEKGRADKVWGPQAEQKRRQRATPDAVATALGVLVDQDFSAFQATLYGRLVQTGRGVRAALPVVERRLGSGRKIKPAWLAVYYCLQVVETRRDTIEASHQRLHKAHKNLVTAQRRVQRETKREHDRRKQEADAEQRAAEARNAVGDGDALLARYGRLEEDWTLSSRQLRFHGWEATLLRRLTGGIRDAGGRVVVPRLSRPKALAVLAVLQLACEYGERTGQRLAELLADEDDLFGQRAQVLATMSRLSVNAPTRTELAQLEPRLRQAYEWLAEHGHHVIPVLSAEAPTATESLRHALEEIHSGQ